MFFPHTAPQIYQNFGGERGENKCQVAVQYVSFCCWNVLISGKLLSLFVFFLLILILELNRRLLAVRRRPAEGM